MAALFVIPWLILVVFFPSPVAVKTIRIGHFSTDTAVVANANQLFKRTFDIANETNLSLDVEMVTLPSGVHGIERLESETLDISWMGNTVLSYGLSRGADLKVIYGQMEWVSTLT